MNAEMSKEKKIPYLNFLSSDVVSLQAGHSGPLFKIHSDLLNAKCPAIARAFLSGFKESQTGVCTFEDFSAGTLGRFIEWAYTGDYPSVIEAAGPGSKKKRKDKKKRKGGNMEAKAEDEGQESSLTEVSDSTSENDPLLAHIQLYILSSMYFVGDLQELSFDKLSACLADLNKPDQLDAQLAVVTALRVAFFGLPPENPLLDWLAQYAAYCVDKLRQQTEFLRLLSESPILSSRMILSLHPASSPPWKTGKPKFSYTHYLPSNSREGDSD